MEDELTTRLQAWKVPGMPDGLDERIDSLLVSPSELPLHAPRQRWWPALVFAGCVAALVWSTALVVSQDDPRVPAEREGIVAISETPGVVTAQLSQGRTRDDRPLTSQVPLISRVVLDGYVAIADAQVVVERRSR